MSHCGECNDAIGKNNSSANCTSCKTKYHFDKCSGISSATWKARGKDKKPWKCKKCREKSNSENRNNSEEGNSNTNENENNEVINQENELTHESNQENQDESDGSQETMSSDKSGKKVKTNEDKQNNGNNVNKEESAQIKEDLSALKLLFVKMDTKMDNLLSKYDKLIGMQTEVTEIIKSITFLQEEQNDLKKENTEMKEKLKNMEERLNKMESKKDTSANLEMKMHQIEVENKEKEQYDRNRNLEINQLDWLANEKLNDLIPKLAQIFNVRNFRQDQIETMHRIPNRNKNKCSSIIIQFKHREYRTEWLRNRKVNVTNDDVYKNGNKNKVYINENMSPYYKTLFWKTKMYAKSNNIKYVWFSNGKVHMRVNENEERVITVRSELDLT